MDHNNEVELDIDPFILDIPRLALIEYVRLRIESTKTLVAGSHGRQRMRLGIEERRLREWIAALEGRGEEDVAVLIVEERIAHAAHEAPTSVFVS